MFTKDGTMSVIELHLVALVTQLTNTNQIVLQAAHKEHILNHYATYRRNITNSDDLTLILTSEVHDAS
jgi:hypothetical protein